MHVSSILLLAPLLSAAPTGSSPSHFPSRAALPKAGFPEGVQIQKDLPGIFSLGPVLVESVNNGIRANQVVVGGSNEYSRGRPENNDSAGGFQQFQGLMEALNKENGKHGKDALSLSRPLISDVGWSGPSSKEIFQTQAMSIAMEKAIEKELDSHFGFLPDVQKNEGKEKPKGGQASAVKVTGRPKILRPLAESEAITYVISEPSKASLKPPPGSLEGKTLASSHCSTHPCHLQTSATFPPQRSTTTRSTAQSDGSRAPATISGAQTTSPDIQSAANKSSTKEVRNLRSAYAVQTEKYV